MTYLNEGDHLHVKEITETSTDTQEKSLSSVRTMLASTQSALWDFFMDKSRRHEADGSFDKLTGQTFMERAKWIPLRLTLKERKVFRLGSGFEFKFLQLVWTRLSNKIQTPSHSST